jgi:hypothetical protein
MCKYHFFLKLSSEQVLHLDSEGIYSKECTYAKLGTGEQYDPVMPSVLITWITGSHRVDKLCLHARPCLHNH